VSDPEETAPFTHQPYGGPAEDNPFVSPSGPAAQPSGPGYVTPPAAPPPTVPYGSPQPGDWLGYPPGGFAPAYGAYPGVRSHPGATKALVLGIISIVALVLGPFLCCVTVPGVLCAPFAWVIGARATREISSRPGVYSNLSAAQTGMWMGIVTSILGVLLIGGGIALVAWLGYTDYSLV
jgi:hypothetical protein